MGLATLATPAPGADPGPSHRICSRDYGIFHIAAFALLLGVKLKDVPPGIGTRQDILATRGLPLES